MLELSKQLRISRETIRRHIQALVERGLVARARQRMRLADIGDDDELWAAYFHENAGNVQRLFAELAERGVVEAWRAAPSDNSRHGAA